MPKPKFGKNSPLAYRAGETQGVYWDRLGEIARRMMKQNMVSRYATERLAYIMTELPSDFDGDRLIGTGLFNEMRQFLSAQNDEVRKEFRAFAIKFEPLYAHPHKHRLNFVLPPEKLGILKNLLERAKAERAELGPAGYGDEKLFREVLETTFEIDGVNRTSFASRMHLARPTVDRWKAGISAPHPVRRNEVYLAIEKWLT